MALLALLLTGVGVFVGWRFGRHQTSLSALPVDDGELAVVRAIYEFGPAMRIAAPLAAAARATPLSEIPLSTTLSRKTLSWRWRSSGFVSIA